MEREAAADADSRGRPWTRREKPASADAIHALEGHLLSSILFGSVRPSSSRFRHGHGADSLQASLLLLLLQYLPQS
jgi:hypothetical protein